MSEPAPTPPKLPVEADELPILDALVVEAICAEHRRSLLRLADRLLGWRWTTEQITFVAERWPWEWLARVVAAERLRRGEPLVNTATLASLRDQLPGQGPSASTRNAAAEDAQNPAGGGANPFLRGG